jgi:hypothetical protein
MRLIRSRFAALALALLAWQIAGVAVTSVALCCFDSARAGSDEDVACTCDHAGSAICPMHKTVKKQSTDPQSHRTRWCAGCGDQAGLMIQTMLAAWGGLPESRHRVIRPAATAERMFLASAALPDAVRPPVSPPPRRSSLSISGLDAAESAPDHTC